MNYALLNGSALVVVLLHAGGCERTIACGVSFVPLNVQVVDAETGRPVPGAYVGSLPGSPSNAELDATFAAHTNTEGRALLSIFGGSSANIYGPFRIEEQTWGETPVLITHEAYQPLTVITPAGKTGTRHPFVPKGPSLTARLKPLSVDPTR